jgi:hypothetical protein
MKVAPWCFAVVVCFLLCSVLPAAAQVPTHIEYDFAGTGGLLSSPINYTGSITAGEPLLIGGTWDLGIDDTGWPSDADKAARWSYVNSTYFAPNYSPISLSWTAIFNQSTTASSPTWTAGNTGVGDLMGTAVVQMSISDFDGDVFIDPDERGFMLLSGTLIVVKFGTGIWAGYCGLGSYSGFTFSSDPVNYVDHDISGSTILDIEDCTVANEKVTWGSVKQKYTN